MTLLRCPKFLRCLTADAPNFDRGHSLSSLPTSARVLYYLQPSVGATLAVARGRGRAPPLRTAKYASVGRAALSPPPVNHRTITAA